MNYKNLVISFMFVFISHNADALPINFLQNICQTAKITAQKKIKKTLGLDEIQKQITFIGKNIATKDDFIKEINKVDNEPNNMNNDSSCPSTKDLKK